MLADKGKNTSTIRRALAAITHAHRLRGLEPTHEAVRSVMAGIRRKLEAKPERKQGLRALEERYHPLWCKGRCIELAA